MIRPAFCPFVLDWQTYFTNKGDNLLLCIFDIHFNQLFLLVRT